MCGRRLSRTFVSMTATAKIHTLDPVTIRHATPSDAFALQRLAEVDSSPSLGSDVLLAEVCDSLVAALRPNDRAVVADPCVRTTDYADLLAARADRVCSRARPPRTWQRL